MNDLISRQDAIDAINELHDKPNAWLDLAVDSLENLPSIDAVQYTNDEIQRMQDIEQAQIQKAYDLGYAEGKADAVPQWIPCSERLPEEEEDVLISIKGNGVHVGFIDSNFMNGSWSEQWWVAGKEIYADDEFDLVEAWMPLPKPYERKES